MSNYQNITSQAREALAAARKPGEEIPKCAAYFNNADPCDLFRSHDCGESEISMAYRALFAPAF